MSLNIPASSLYKGAKNVMTVQAPRAAFASPYAVPEKTAKGLMSALRRNKNNYDVLRGRINAQADQAGMKLNILFSEKHPGKLEVEIIDKSIPTSRDLMGELSGMFTDPLNMGKHFKEVRTMIKNAANSDKKGGITKILIDPNENYAQKVADALLDAIEAKEFARIK